MFNYPPHYYSEQGLLKPSLFYWMSLVYFTRAWWLFIIAGASRQQGSGLLSLFYPNQTAFYLGLTIGLPAMFLFFLSGNLHKIPLIIRKRWQIGRLVLLLSAFMELYLTGSHIVSHQGEFHWGTALSLVMLLWITSYLIRSKRTKALFEQFGGLSKTPS